MKTGSYYYSLSYAPTDKAMLGRYRRIEVKLRGGHYKLAYRRGYFEEGKVPGQSEQQLAAADPLQPLLQRGLPNATQIVFNLRVVRTTALPAATTTIAGDNNKLHDPVTRFGADFVVPVESLNFDITGDGVRHGNVELALEAYDHDDKPLNWKFRSITTSLKPDVYPAVQKTGEVFHQDIDIPPGEAYLRAGIYDLRSSMAGTLEIPLSEVTAVNVGLANTQKPAAAVPSPAPPASTSEAKTFGNESNPAEPDRTKAAFSAANPPNTTLLPYPVRQPSAEEIREAEIIDIPAYCAQLSQRVQHSSALANVCRFALFSINRFPDLICHREMRSEWLEFRPLPSALPVPVYKERSNAPSFSWKGHSDVLSAEVTYRGGQEYYDHLVLNGQPVSSEASTLPPPSLSGPWSVGEFGMILESIFLPASKAEFQFKKQTRIASAAALLFSFHVAAANNRYYFLFAGEEKWFPEYRGELWVDENGFRLLRLERQTGRMEQYPIQSVKTAIHYAPISLADGSTLVLPSNSEVKTCTPPGGNCARSLVTFTNWHRFKATTKVVTNPSN